MCIVGHSVNLAQQVCYVKVTAKMQRIVQQTRKIGVKDDNISH
jgi:hypothetical protein